MRAQFLALTFLASAVASAALAAQAPPRNTFMNNKEIMGLIDKAKADRKDNAPLVAEPILSLAPYRAQLEYRPATSPAAVHEKDAELMVVLEGTGNIVTGGKLVEEKRGKQREHSPNVALRDEALRNYADYMLSPEFQDAARTLVELAGTSKTAVMCAEKNFSNCHRSLISDYLTLHGHEVLHIEDLSPPQRHRLSADAHLFEGQVIYSPEDLFRDKLA